MRTERSLSTGRQGGEPKNEPRSSGRAGNVPSESQRVSSWNRRLYGCVDVNTRRHKHRIRLRDGDKSARRRGLAAYEHIGDWGHYYPMVAKRLDETANGYSNRDGTSNGSRRDRNGSNRTDW